MEALVEAVGEGGRVVAEAGLGGGGGGARVGGAGGRLRGVPVRASAKPVTAKTTAGRSVRTVMRQLARWASPKCAAAVPGRAYGRGIRSGLSSRRSAANRLRRARMPAPSVAVTSRPTVVTLVEVASV
ncbi:hypothetical protein ACFQ2B_26670 [Streptomyces stramineus]